MQSISKSNPPFQAGTLNENPRGWVLREVPPIDFVNRREHLELM